jgi:molybdopterin-synthase adenylyltransferase
VHAFGPRGWFEARGFSVASVREVLRASGAWRHLPNTDAERVAHIYSDPLKNRAFAFLDAALGPRAALITVERLAKLEVGVVGCGGIGSSVAYLLGGMGVTRFVLVDPDIVEEGNLPRQVLYTLGDAGRPKVSALANALRSRFRGVVIEEFRSDALSPIVLERLQLCSTIVCAGDEPPTLAADLHDRLLATPVWTCGYALGRSIVRPPKATARAANSMPIAWSSVPNGFAPSIGFQNMEIAAACVARLALGLSKGDTAQRRRWGRVYELDYTTL